MFVFHLQPRQHACYHINVDWRAVLVTTIAGVKDRASFICTTQLLSVVSDFFPATLLARLPDRGIRLHIVLGEGLQL